MKALVGAFNQEKALVGAFSVIVQPVVESMDRFTALNDTDDLTNPLSPGRGQHGAECAEPEDPGPRRGRVQLGLKLGKPSGPQDGDDLQEADGDRDEEGGQGRHRGGGLGGVILQVMGLLTDDW